MEPDLSRPVILGNAARRITLAEVDPHKHQIIDVRAAEEFKQGTIPGAVNIPLFDDDERSVIGTIYRHGGHENAVEKGFEYVGEKLSNLLVSFQQFGDKELVIYCARGGMRSLSVVNLLAQSGYQAFQLEGGYKNYRHDILSQLETFQPRLIVIHGLTGTGKTRILQHLDNAIDLEGLARHRSSLFGAIDRKPCNQRMFETGLVQTIHSLGQEPYFIEGESRKIGPVFIPKPLAMAMKRAVLVHVHCSMETRIKRIIDDYPVEDEKVLLEIESILGSLKQKLGATKVDTMCQLLRAGDLHELVRTLLLDYYDHRYGKSMSSYNYELDLSSEDIPAAALRLTEFRRCLTSYNFSS